MSIEWRCVSVVQLIKRACIPCQRSSWVEVVTMFSPASQHRSAKDEGLDPCWT